MQKKIIERYFFFGLFLATFIFSFFIFQPFWIVIILGISFAIVLHPLYEWLNKRGLPRALSSFLTVLLFLIILCGPLLGIGVIVFHQSQNAYNFLSNGGQVGPFVDALQKGVNDVLPTGVNFDVNQKVSDLVLFLTNNLAKIFSSTLSVFFSFTLMLLSIFYFLKDGKDWKEALVRLSPLGEEDDEKIIKRFSNSVNGVVKGYILIALVQGALMGIGLWFVGVPNPALWAVVAAIASMIPMVGTSLISVPSILYLFITGNTVGAIELLVWSVVLVGTIDNILNPYLISGKIDIPPLLVLFSVLGGISLFGPIGVLIGPITISLLYTLVSIYNNEYKEK